MASLQFSSSSITLSSGGFLRVFSQRDNSYHLIEEDLSSSDGTVKQGDGTKTNKDSQDPCRHILCSIFSPSGRFICCVDSEKSLYLWQSSPWKLVSKRTIQKRGTAVTFTNSEKEILVADKFGDVYQFSVDNPEDEGMLLLGHVSMILDMAVSHDDKFIITCDRDEKVRISCLPNSYNIHGYCLGHTEFVSRCEILPEHSNVLITAGGDNTLRLWDIKECTQITSSNISYESRTLKPGEHFTVTHLTCSSKGYVAIALLGEHVVLVYRVTEESGLQLTEVGQLKLDAVVLCLTFDPSGCLWVIHGSQTDTAQIFQIDLQNEQKIKKIDTLADPWQTAVLNAINADWEFLKDASKAESPLASLHKKSYDNVKEYLEKKQERIAREEIRKEKYEARQARQEQRKRMKVDGEGD